MLRTLQEFHEGAERSIALFNFFSQIHELIGISRVDHLSYKCGSRESFEATRKMLETESEYMYQSVIAGRRIAYFRLKLKNEIETFLGPIQFVELGDQKPDGSQKDGFDHAEIYPTECTYEEFVRELGKEVVLKQSARAHHPTHDTDIGEGFEVRCTHGPLVDKIKATEMK